jgi:hypothetical protein
MRTRCSRRLAGLLLLITLVAQAAPAADSTTQPATRPARIGMRLTAEEERHLRGLEEHDRPSFAKADLKPEQIEAASTQELVRFFCEKLGSALLLYEGNPLGVERAARSCSSLQAILARPDTIDGILAYAKSVDWERVERPEYDPRKEYHMGFLALYIDTLLLYQP